MKSGIESCTWIIKVENVKFTETMKVEMSRTEKIYENMLFLSSCENFPIPAPQFLPTFLPLPFFLSHIVAWPLATYYKCAVSCHSILLNKLKLILKQ